MHRAPGKLPTTTCAISVYTTDTEVRRSLRVLLLVPSLCSEIFHAPSGRDIVDYLEHGLSYHVAQELKETDVDMETKLTRAFLMADIHSHQAGVHTSGAAVALCLIKVSESRAFHLLRAHAFLITESLHTERARESTDCSYYFWRDWLCI